MRYWRVMRCVDGHLFETPFLPMLSLKAIRTPRGRIMRCPVDKHAGPVELMYTAELTPGQRQEARHNRTSPIP